MATEASTWCFFIFIIIKVLAWANCVVYPVWVGQCESLCSQDRRENKHLRLFRMYRRVNDLVLGCLSEETIIIVAVTIN